MTASWCRSVAGPGVLRDSIKPMAQGCRIMTARIESARCRIFVFQLCSLTGRSISLKRNRSCRPGGPLCWRSGCRATYGVSRQHVHRWLARYRDQGIDGVEPRFRRPHSNPQRTASEVAARIVALRQELAGQGLDHGPQRIGWHLGHEHLEAPSTSTIRRILLAASLVTAEPKKRPKSSYRRFEADQPNECWQSDFTHWRLTDGTGWRSSTGSTTTPATFSPPSPGAGSPVRTWSPPSSRRRQLGAAPVHAHR
jgi:hypothetical protein